MKSKILGRISQMSFRHENREKSTYQYMSANSFRGTAPTFSRRRSFRPLCV